VTIFSTVITIVAVAVAVVAVAVAVSIINEFLHIYLILIVSTVLDY
jgi:hypothetical protein